MLTQPPVYNGPKRPVNPAPEPQPEHPPREHKAIPVVGDLIASAFSLWLVREARALGAPWHITARMLANVALEGTVGLVPIAGDAFDVMFRANIRNVRMLRRWMEKQR